MHDPREALRQAVVLLIESPDAERLHESLTATIRLARLHPVRLTGQAEALNPLLELGTKDPDALSRMIALVDAKRAQAGRAPLYVPPDDKFDKADYMRAFMDQKRQRQRRAVEIENAMRPERDRLIGRHRLDFMDARAAEWKQELDALIARAREATGKRLPKDHLDTLRAQFWAGVDKKLDELEAQNRQRMLRKT